MLRTYRVAISAASSGSNELVAAVAGTQIRVTNFALVAVTAVTVQFKSASTALTGVMSMGATGVLAPGPDLQGHFITASGEALNLSLGGSVQVSGWLTYDIGGTT
tara:strand:+ start:860 stop:1174 length:315 start_codon:yes stop_codon:yes gene_type:complete